MKMKKVAGKNHRIKWEWGWREEDPPKPILYLAMTLEKPLGCENKDLYDLKAFSKMLKC